MDVAELCKKSIALANKDKDYLKKIEKLTVSLAIEFKDKPEENFSIMVENGKIKVGKEAKADFEIETKTKDFYKVVIGKTPGLIAMATRKIKLKKGDMTELGKLIPALSGLTHFGKKALESEELQPVRSFEENERATGDGKRVLKGRVKSHVFSIVISCWGLILAGFYVVGLILGYGSLKDTLQHLTQPSVFVPSSLLFLTIPAFMLIGYLYQKQQNLAKNLEQLVEERTRRLQESQAKLKNIFASSPDAISVTDLNGNVIECNQATLDMHGYSSKEEVIGKNAFIFIAEKDHERAMESMKKTLEQGSVRNIEYTFLTKDGREFQAELSASVIKGSSGNPTGFVAITKDITERKKMEKKMEEYSEHLEELVEKRTKELKESQERLLKSERLAAIGELATIVGHDLRNPLTGIATATYYLKKKLASEMDKKTKEMLEIIEKDIEYSDKIISDLLDYSREIKLELTETTPKSIMKEALSFVEVPKKIHVLDVTQSEPKVKVDVAKIRRVFVNIMKNAIDAMPKGGKLTIKSKKLDGNVEIAITDTGMGIPQDVLEKIWTPLFTTKAKGMGLGLSISKHIVEVHGGDVSVESTVGKGTTLTVTIPVKPTLEGGEKVWVKRPESLLSTTTKA